MDIPLISRLLYHMQVCEDWYCICQLKKDPQNRKPAAGHHMETVTVMDKAEPFDLRERERYKSSISDYYTALRNVPKSSVDLNGPSQRSQVNIS